jgi:bacterioferritin
MEEIMSKKAIEIVKLDVKKIIVLLNKALADEWLAYYQYWIGAKVAKGPMRPAIAAELAQHASEEFKHAGMLVDRIIQLGGTPIINPESFGKLSNCDYLEPKDPNVKTLLKQNIEGERCAIGVYSQLVEITKDKDIVTYDMALSILKDEIEHEADLEALLEDLGAK